MRGVCTMLVAEEILRASGFQAHGLRNVVHQPVDMRTFEAREELVWYFIGIPRNESVKEPASCRTKRS